MPIEGGETDKVKVSGCCMSGGERWPQRAKVQLAKASRVFFSLAAQTSASEQSSLGWTLETKYYSAELSIWTAHLDDRISLQRLMASKKLAALVMVFDMCDESSFIALKDMVAEIDIGKFQILLCIGNKADLVAGHYAHTEYRRLLQKHGELDGNPEFWDYGISETEGCSLLGNEDPSAEIRKSCVEWCIEHSIEYIEACASNVHFDKCLSIDGDVQGVERLYGALAAHMWPGMVLKSGNLISLPVLAEEEDSTDDDSDYDIKYEVLSRGSDEPRDSINDFGTSSRGSSEPHDNIDDFGASSSVLQTHANENNDVEAVKAEACSSPCTHPNPQHNDFTSQAESEKEAETSNDNGEDTIQVWASTSEAEGREFADAIELVEDSQFSYNDLERLMGEIGNMRGNLRLMPDFQRRETAAKLALKMAALFGESSDEDGL